MADLSRRVTPGKLILICSVLATLSIQNGVTGEGDCTTKRTCRDCLNDKNMPECGWCGSFDGNAGGCMSRTANSTCPKGFWFDERSKISKVTAGDSTEVSAKSVTVFLRPGEELQVQVSVMPETCKFVDLYILMDFSGSMDDDLDNIRKLAKNLTAVTQSLCNSPCANVTGGAQCARIGFGSFIEKPRHPAGIWSSSSYWEKNSPVNSVFRPRFNLSSNMADFEQYLSTLSANEIKSNYDWAEGMKVDDRKKTWCMVMVSLHICLDQFEAMLQVLRCRRLINWTPRDDSKKQPRRIILVLTDADFHLRGEGGVLGLNEPNPDKCYVDESGDLSNTNNVYAQIDKASLLYDYPTLWQIRNALISTNTVPIFAASIVSTSSAGGSKNEKIYPDLLKTLGFGFSTTLNSTSENVMEVLRDSYNSISSTLSMAVAQNGNEVLVRSISPSAYSGITAGSTYPFTVTLYDDGSLGKAPNATVNLSIMGFGNIQIVVIRGVDCSASCTKFCSVNGTALCKNGAACECGRCDCAARFKGTNCECDANTQCPTVNGAECNGQGACECGRCKCRDPFNDPGYPTCTCFVGPCPTKTAGLVCSGHGACTCSSCNCQSGWTLADCSCKSGDNKTCGVGEAIVCNNHGKCNTCGQCDCDPGFRGPTCDTVVPSCPTNCSGHGTCVGAGQCACVDNYTGSDCACPPCKDPTCNERGTCECGVCKCIQGYDSSTDCKCVEKCDGNIDGTLSCNCDGTITCKPGWEGAPSGCWCSTDRRCYGSPICSGHGTCNIENCNSTSTPEIRGTCDCFVGYTHANTSEFNAVKICDCLEADCPGDDKGQCYGHGTCTCGACVCNNGFEVSSNCRCPSNSTCPTFEGQPCGGSERGECTSTTTECKQCFCRNEDGRPLFTGNNCNCSTLPCPIDPNTGVQCGDNGVCECGKCKCPEGKGGSYCQCGLCPRNDTTLADGTFVRGIECSGRGTCDCGICKCDLAEYDTASPKGACEYCNIDYVNPDTVTSNQCPNDTCTAYAGSCDGCMSIPGCFKCADFSGCYNAVNRDIKCNGKYFTSSSSCPLLGRLTTTEVAGVFGGVFGGLIAAGAAGIIAYKVINVMRDKKEWEKFESEKAKSAWKADQNPLYVASTIEHVNPIYND